MNCPSSVPRLAFSCARDESFSTAVRTCSTPIAPASADSVISCAKISTCFSWSANPCALSRPFTEALCVCLEAATTSSATSPLRSANLRTSLATTAKPRPASPARAASTAAFNAKIFVCWAIPTISVMLATIRLLASTPCSACSRVSPERIATSEATFTACCEC